MATILSSDSDNARKGLTMAALGIILILIGAILSFAVADQVDGANLELIGYILMGAGVLAFLFGLFQNARTGRAATTNQVTTDGHTPVQERRID